MMTSSPDRSKWCLAVLTGFLAIAAEPGGAGAQAARDSGGVRIVERHAAPAWGDRPWRAEVRLRFGSAGGEDAYLFQRIGDVARDGLGRFLVLDQGLRELRLFDATGRFVQRVAGPGAGPGELSAAANAVLIVPGDTSVVADPGQARLSLFGPDGAFVRMVTLPRRPNGQSWEVLPGGGYAFRGLSISRGADGQFQFWDGLLTIAADGSGLDTLLTLPYEKTSIGGPGAIRVPLIVNSPSWARLDDGGFAWTALDQDRVWIHDASGRPVAAIGHAAWTRRATTRSDRARLVELLRQKLKALGGDPSAADGPNVELWDRLPAITGLRSGPEGTLWVQRMGPIEAVDPMAVNATDRSEWIGGDQWDVFDRTWRWLGAVTMPERIRITRIERDAIVGIARGPDDVEQVVLLRIDRGGTR